MNKKFVLLDGTSSSGKSTICNFFNKKKFSCLQIDYYDYCNKKVKNKWLNTLKNLKNEYNHNTNFDTMIRKMMFEDSLKIKSNVLLDDVSQFELIQLFKENKLINNLYIINVFANLKTLSRNLELRRKECDPRSTFAFSQFADRYIKTDENNSKKIEKINRNNFKNLLLKYFKYEFSNKKHLINFSNEIFKKMEIDDDNDHFIKVRDNIKYDYLLNTSNKTKQEIFKELQENVFDNNKFFLNNKNSKTRKKLSK